MLDRSTSEGVGYRCWRRGRHHYDLGETSDRPVSNPDLSEEVMTTHRMIRRTCGLLAALAMTVGVAACGSSDDEPSTASGGYSAATEASEAAATRLDEYLSDP